MKTDLDLRRDVEAELDWDPRFDSRDIGVAVKEGVVTLSGHVPNYLARWEAQEAVKSVAGVKAIANEIQVRLQGDTMRSDSEIADAILNALQLNVSVPPAEIRTVVRDGWITLEGTVNWWYQKNAAEITVRNLRGVKGVTNNIVIKPKMSALDIKSKIENAFQRHALSDAKNIRVIVGDGAVTLEGEVRSWQERQDAEAAAWAAPGVCKVNDHLVVRS